MRKCTQVQNDSNRIDKIFDKQLDNEYTFSASYFHEKPIVDVETIEERLTPINLHRVEKKADLLSSYEYHKEIIVQYKKKILFYCKTRVH